MEQAYARALELCREIGEMPQLFSTLLGVSIYFVVRAVVDEALASVNKTAGRWAEAELHLLRGELLMEDAACDLQRAESCFHQALAVARRQQAKSVELRAAMSISRLWQRQGKNAEARRLLGDAYSWFTEGFDTADLKQARTILDELA